ncbi:MAG TPA: ribosome small subunit-dependent GTPase A [Clostridia bacterium]|nr:ribosome small subunit-dependent GTPase A [Clostridia bacterium]HPQ46127.1 ribosome small subunit-dependent GTPase A [Clostridia bacterium]
MPEGIILKGVGGLYTVKSSCGIYGCRARGLFRKDGITPLPGDYVTFDITDENDMEGYISGISDRRNDLVRPAVANVDLAFIVVSPLGPEPDFMLVDKLICIFESKGIEPVICINKSDLADYGTIEEIGRPYEKAGYSVIATNAKSGDGIDRLESMLPGRVALFSGQSGVGKSTLLNRIIGDYRMETGELSEKIGRGKHTTRHAEFIEADSGFIVDTPGFSSLDPGLLDYTRIPYLYREFRKYEDKCRFGGCLHMNEPGCAVKEAVEENLISRDRHSRYVKIYMQAKEAETRRRGY